MTHIPKVRHHKLYSDQTVTGRVTHGDTYSFRVPERSLLDRGVGGRRDYRGNASPASPASPASAILEALAGRLVRLSWSWTDPERAHLEKHAIASDMRRLAREMRRARA